MSDHQMEVACHGLSEALNRIRSGHAEVLQGQDLAIGLEVAVAEALWWTLWIDERFFLADKGAYRGKRDSYVGSELFTALKYVRDRCTHQSPAVLRHKPSGWVFPIVFPISGPSVVWDHPDNMGEPRNPQPRQFQLVEDLLTGQPVTHAFWKAKEWYESEGLAIPVE